MKPERADEPVGPQHLASDDIILVNHPKVKAFASQHGVGETPTEKAIALFYAVRDGFRYDPYKVVFDREGFTTEVILNREPAHGHCIDKANVLVASARALGIPSRLHFANVRNHLGTARLEETLGNDLLVFHGYAELHLNGRWVAATPAFNKTLCEHLGVEPLEFDGVIDCRLQAFDRNGGGFMTTVTDHGSYAGLPFTKMITAWREHYPVLREMLDQKLADSAVS